MTNLNILIVEGNDPKNNEFFKKAAKASCSENLKKLVLKLKPNSNIEIINPKILFDNYKWETGISKTNFTLFSSLLNDLRRKIKNNNIYLQ